MLLLLQLATRRERQIIQDNRQSFLSTMRDLRRLVQRMSPDGEFRSYEWRRLQREAPRLINDFVAGLHRDVLMPELVALEAPVQEFAQDYADIDRDQLCAPDRAAGAWRPSLSTRPSCLCWHT